MTDIEIKIEVVKAMIKRIKTGANNYMCLALNNVLCNKEHNCKIDSQNHANTIELELLDKLKEFKPKDSIYVDWFSPEATAGTPKGKAKRLKVLKTILKQYQNGE